MADRGQFALGPLQGVFEEALSALVAANAVERIWAKDPTLWSDDPNTPELGDRLGWLTVIDALRSEADALLAFGGEVRDAGYTRVIVLGMGGSSLCVEVLRLSIGSAAGFPALGILDTTDPVTIRALAASLDLTKTIFVVASKSGGTVETLSHAAYFYELVKQQLGDRAGANFVAITDPGSKLSRLAADLGYRRTFLNQSDIGGRYSVLSYFGLVPAALAGIDVGRLLDRAIAMANECKRPGHENPGLLFGAAIGAAATGHPLGGGRDKLTIVTEPGLASFGDWAEQLIAESTGKHEHGIVPIAGETLGASAVYGEDRLFVQLALPGEAPLATAQPHIHLSLADVYDLGAEFLRWEFATAVAGKVLAINPFDQPNVQESKDNTNRLLGEYAEAGKLPEPAPVAEGDGLALITPDGGGDAAKPFADVLNDFLRQVKPGDYLALEAYIAGTPEHEAALQALRHALRDRLHVATTLGYGPRFLHSTGQLHKGGANNGVFIQFVAPAADGDALPIPGQGYDFGTLKAAQALGDLQSLASHGRRAIRIDLGSDIRGGLAKLQGMIS